VDQWEHVRRACASNSDALSHLSNNHYNNDNKSHFDPFMQHICRIVCLFRSVQNRKEFFLTFHKFTERLEISQLTTSHLSELFTILSVLFVANPIYDESFEFHINLPELALVRFSVLDDDFIGDEFIGQYTIPFACMQPGNALSPVCSTKTWSELSNSIEGAAAADNYCVYRVKVEKFWTHF